MLNDGMLLVAISFTILWASQRLKQYFTHMELLWVYDWMNTCSIVSPDSFK